MRKLLILLLAVISLNVTAQKDSVLLRLNPQRGSEYLQTMKMEVNTPDIKMANTITMKSKVIDVQNDKVMLENHTKRIIFDTEMMDRKIYYDSDVPKENMDKTAQEIDKNMRELKDMVIVTTLNRQGKILNIKGVTEQYKQMFKDNQYSIEFPKKAVRVGSTWSDTSVQMKVQTMTLQLNNQYTVKDITDKTVVLTLKTNGAIDMSEKTEDEDAKMGFKVKGEMIIDRKTGQLMNSEIVSTMKMMEQDIKTKTTITTQNL